MNNFHTKNLLVVGAVGAFLFPPPCVRFVCSSPYFCCQTLLQYFTTFILHKMNSTITLYINGRKAKFTEGIDPRMTLIQVPFPPSN
jgi:hypothetical protein